MNRRFSILTSLLMAALGMAALGTAAQAQQYVVKNIIFNGQTEYTPAELMAAAGLKKGQALTAADMNARSKQLLDMGVFDNVAFTFNGQDLTFQVIPSKLLYAAKMENLPLAPGKELDAKLHARVSLYHGLVPVEGGLLDEVKKALEDELAAQGIEAAVVLPTPETDARLGTTIAVGFTETSPAVEVGEVKVEASAGSVAAAAQAAATRLVGTSFNGAGSESVLGTAVENAYRDQAYLQVAAHATAKFVPVVTADAVKIPFVVTVDAGPQFKLGAVTLDPSMVVTQEAYDQQAKVHPGDLALMTKLRTDWEYLTRQYHNNGMVKARVLTTATYDREKGLASYALNAEPGPVYRMGALMVENQGGPEVRTAIQNAWKMPRGAVFNEGSVLTFMPALGTNSVVDQFFSTERFRYSLHLNDDIKAVDVQLRFEKKQ